MALLPSVSFGTSPHNAPRQHCKHNTASTDHTSPNAPRQVYRHVMLRKGPRSDRRTEAYTRISPASTWCMLHAFATHAVRAACCPAGSNLKPQEDFATLRVRLALVVPHEVEQGRL